MSGERRFACITFWLRLVTMDLVRKCRNFQHFGFSLPVAAWNAWRGALLDVDLQAIAHDNVAGRREASGARRHLAHSRLGHRHE
jgi:hypothetical protein